MSNCIATQVANRDSLNGYILDTTVPRNVSIGRTYTKVQEDACIAKGLNEALTPIAVNLNKLGNTKYSKQDQLIISSDLQPVNAEEIKEIFASAEARLNRISRLFGSGKISLSSIAVSTPLTSTGKRNFEFVAKIEGGSVLGENAQDSRINERKIMFTFSPDIKNTSALRSYKNIFDQNSTEITSVRSQITLNPGVKLE